MVLQSKKKVPVLFGTTRETVNNAVGGALNNFHHDCGSQ